MESSVSQSSVLLQRRSAGRYFPTSTLIGSLMNFTVLEEKIKKVRVNDSELSPLILVRFSLDRCGSITGLQYPTHKLK